MNITEIATLCVDEMEPSLKRVVDSYDKSKSKNPEMATARKAFAEKRERMIERVSLAITDAVVADRMCSELRQKNYDHVLKEICVTTSPHTPRELCTTLESVEWLVDRHKAASAALYKLEEIRTEKLAVNGLPAEASAVSAARVILQSKRKAAAKADEKPDGQAENDLAMTAPHQTPIPDNVLPALVISDLLAVGFKLEPSTGRFWHWAESPGIELIEGKWFPCDMFDNGDMQYSDDGYESPVEAAKQAVKLFS